MESVPRISKPLVDKKKNETPKKYPSLLPPKMVYCLFSVRDTKAFSPSMRAGGSEHILLLLQLLFLQV
jgi:hypothetical protein